jgi:hypothetical protein
MTQDEIFKMAKEVKFAIDVSNDPNSPPSWWGAAHNDKFEAFAKLVAAKEREACALLAEKLIAEEYFDVATEIRARGQA